MSPRFWAFCVFASLCFFTIFVPPGQLSGIVVDDNGPVADVFVRFQGQTNFTKTDPQGRFSLPTDPTGSRLTAWKEGYSIAGILPQKGSLKLQLLRLPSEDNIAYRWIDPTPSKQAVHNCGNCHPQIYKEWQASGHAHAADNRHLLSLFAGTDWHGRPVPDWNVRKENVLGAGVCATCHAPTMRDPMLEYDLRQATGVSRQGVHCDYCHKIADAHADPRGLRFGKEGHDLLRPPDGQQLSFGPIVDAFREGEFFAYAPVYKESRYCASCHEGVIFGVHVYGTYSEWEKSPARQRGQHCQSCHMTPTGKMTNMAPGHGGIERPASTLAKHSFPGRQADMLRRCLKLDVHTTKKKDGIHVRVGLTAENVGHRVPSGFLDRNLLLRVDTFDAKGNVGKLLSGTQLSELAGAEWQGKAGWIYAKQLAGPNGEKPVPFWAPHGQLEDTRLFPEVEAVHHFVFSASVRKVRVRLVYRRFWHKVAESRGFPDNDTLVWDRVMVVSKSE